MRRGHVSDLYLGLRDGARIVADNEGGYITVKVDDEVLFGGTISDSMVVFTAIIGLIGKKNAKKILKMRGFD